MLCRGYIGIIFPHPLLKTRKFCSTGRTSEVALDVRPTKFLPARELVKIRERQSSKGRGDVTLNPKP